MKFSDLNFQPHPVWFDGVQARHFFDNGYGISVIRSQYSYGGSEDLYEVAVLKGEEEDYTLYYESEITDDVLGFQSEEQIESVLFEIEKL
jgi:hypothetical protein